MSKCALETRRCGLLELNSVYRTNLEIYSNVLVSMKYVPRAPLSLDEMYSAVSRALKLHVLPQHPLLNCEITDGSSDKPFFRRIPRQELPVRMVKDWGDISNSLRRDHDERLSNANLWRLSILEDGGAFWLTYTFHHSIGDGTSGLLFHESLLCGLQASDSEPPTARSALPPPIEGYGLDLVPSWRSLLQEVHHVLPLPSFVRSRLPSSAPFYAGNFTTVAQRKRTKTGLSTIRLSPQEVGQLRILAKKHRISVHALIHAAAAHSVDTEMRVKSSTPISLRPMLPEGDRRHIANYISVHQSDSPRQVDPLLTAKEFYREINAKDARIEALHQLGKLAYINNHPPTKNASCGMEEFYLKRLTTSAGHCLSNTFEISNLGNWKPPVTSDWKIEDVYFSSSNSTVGELFWVGVVTLAEGAMNLTCTWRTGYVNELESRRFMRDVHSTLIALGQ